MAAIIIHRTEPFKRGDLSIQILLDGKRAGMLAGDNTLPIEASAGRHRLRAQSNGFRGQECQLEITNGETLHFEVAPPSARPTHWWEMVIAFLLILAPIDRLFGADAWYLAIGVYVVLGVLLMVWHHRKTQNTLCIRPSKTIEASALQTTV